MSELGVTWASLSILSDSGSVFSTPRIGCYSSLLREGPFRQLVVGGDIFVIHLVHVLVSSFILLRLAGLIFSVSLVQRYYLQGVPVS